MRFILVLALISLSMCETEPPVEIIKCILNSDVIFKAIASIIEAVQNKTEILDTIIRLAPQIYLTVKECIVKYGEINLEAGLPDWLQTVINVIGKGAADAWKNGGCAAVKALCSSVLGGWGFVCGLIPC